MKPDELFELLGDIDDRLILEADPENFKPAVLRRPWMKYLSAAVAAVLVLAFVLTFLPFGADPTTDSSSGGNSVQGDSSTDPGDGNFEPPVGEGDISEPSYGDEPVTPETKVYFDGSELYRMFYSIPQRGWSGPDSLEWMYCYGMDTEIRVIEKMYEMGLLDPDTPAYAGDMTNASYPRIPYETVETLFRETWGPFFMTRYDSLDWETHVIPGAIRDWNSQLIYEESSHSYVFYNYPYFRYPDSSGDHFYARLMYTEQEGEDFCVYVRYACYDTEGGQYSIYGEKGGWVIDKDRERTILSRGYDLADYQNADNSIFKKLHSGLFDEYLPVYRVTFKPDENGTYWWAGCREIQIGQEIPAEVLAAPIPEADPSQGIVLPVYGEKDVPSTRKELTLAYFESDYFWVTLNGKFCRYASIQSISENLTADEVILTFTHTQDGTQTVYEVWSAKEYPDYFSIILRNTADGTWVNYYDYS